jgi:uncharacterized protein
VSLRAVSFRGDLGVRLFEARPDAVDCVEFEWEGVFARRSPYLRWLGSQVPTIVRASSLSVGTPGPLASDQLTALADVTAAANARFLVHPLGSCVVDGIRLRAAVPISLTSSALQTVAEHVASAIEHCRVPGLIEPITTVLRVPGPMNEPDFLNAVCRRAGCGLLIDVATLLVASRNHRFDPHSWLAAIDPDLIAAARISGCAERNSRWHLATDGGLDDGAWALMHDLVSRARPDVMILGAHGRRAAASPERNLERLQSLSGLPARPESATPASTSLSILAADSELEQTPIPRAADVSLFVLDTEGVFVSESRRELSLFNTQATFLWCLLEQELSFSEIVSQYRQAFALGEADARRAVGAVFQQWFGLGYLSRRGPWQAPDVPLTTALLQILANAPLREAFRVDPGAVTKALSVAAEESGHFAALDPDALEALAADVAGPPVRRRSWDSASSVSESSKFDSATGRGGGREALERAMTRRYRLLSTTFSIRVDSDAVRAQVHDALAHLESPERNADIFVDVRRGDSGNWLLQEDGSPARSCSAAGVVPAVKQFLREAAVSRHDCLISIHAAVAAFENGCVMLPACAGSGKTTLIAGLIRAGATYFSDELALLDAETLAVKPAPLALTIKDGSLDVLRPAYAEIDALTPHLREDRVRVRYLRPPSASLPVGEDSRPVRWIVFPRYDSTALTTLRPLSRTEGLKRLLAESVLTPERLDRRGAQSLVRWMRSVECYELPMSSWQEAIGLVTRLATSRFEGRERVTRPPDTCVPTGR